MPVEGELFKVVVVVPGQPRGWGRATPIIIAGRARMITDRKTRSEEGAIRSIASAAMGARSPYDGAIILRLCAYRLVPTSFSKVKRAAALAGEIVPITKPDVDNCAKMIDALNGVVWRDDSLIATAVIHKRYSDQPRLVIDVRSFAGQA